MPQKFVNLENLTSFWGNAKEYIGNERKEIEDQLYNWQKTEKASVVQCEPVPNSELHPTVEFKFKETLPEGEKGPENPSTITGMDSIAVGNVFNLYRMTSGYNATRSGVTCTVDSDGVITLNGTCTATDTFATYKDSVPLGKTVFPGGTTLYMKMVELGGTCTLNGTLGVKVQMSCPRTNGTSWYPGIGSTLLEASDSSSVSFKVFSSAVVVYNGAVYNNYRIKAQFNMNEPVQTVENQIENLYTLSLNDTYYGGSIDLSTGVMTVKSQKVVIDEHCTYQNLDNVSAEGFVAIIVTIPDLPVYGSSYTVKTLRNTSTCDSLPLVPMSNYGSYDACLMYNNEFQFFQYRQARLYLKKSVYNIPSNATSVEIATIAKEFFTNHPATLVLGYSEEYWTTVQLIPQQIKSLSSLGGTSKRINTIYTDADSVQVEYQKYVGIDSTLDNDSVNAIQNKVVNSALNTKVSLSGDETISGTKTFSNTINGNITGDAGTVAGHIVSKDVPVNAVFTDTTYDPATQSTAGLMSASDKVKLDAVGSVFSFKGSVTDSSSLPVSDNVNGDAYLAEDTGHVHVYDGTSFVDIGVWAGIPSATDAQIDALFED